MTSDADLLVFGTFHNVVNDRAGRIQSARLRAYANERCSFNRQIPRLARPTEVRLVAFASDGRCRSRESGVDIS